MTLSNFQERLSGRGWAFLPLRLMVGFGFAAHGYAKLSRGPENFAAILAAIGVPHPHVMAWVTSLLEFVGGISIMAGAFVLPLSLPLSVVMLTALFSVHFQYGFSSIRLKSVTASGAEFGPIGYEMNLFYIAGLLTLALGGPGELSVDHYLMRRDARRARSLSVRPSNSSEKLLDGATSTRSFYRIVGARPRDLRLLPAIELAAAAMLAGHAPDSVLSGTTSEQGFSEAQAQKRLWVALAGDAPVGFAHVELLEPSEAHLQEIDVHPDHGRRGLGRRLVLAVCEWAAISGYEAVTLSTFRDVPWNMPFYSSLGFEEIPLRELSPRLVSLVQDEIRRGLDPTRRVVMRRRGAV